MENHTRQKKEFPKKVVPMSFTVTAYNRRSGEACVSTYLDENKAAESVLGHRKLGLIAWSEPDYE